MHTLYEYTDYKAFLAAHLKTQGKGAKLRLAAAIDCQPAYVSQVLSGHAHLSLEHGEKFCGQMGWDERATQYFLLLINLGRAGTASLRKHLTQQIERMRDEAKVLKNRFKPGKILSVEDQATFYSSWHYGAIHASIAIPSCDTELGLSRYYELPVKRVNEIVQFLIGVSLIERAPDGKLFGGEAKIYLGSDSPLISKHHTNWRVRAIEAFDHYKAEHLHYSSVISISEHDVAQVRELMAQTIDKIRSVVRDSKDEKCYSYAMDLFEVR